jgi:uncharacterized small protein (DUF1192 family)
MTALRKVRRTHGPAPALRLAAAGVTLVTAALCAATASAGEWYRYQDDNGVVVLGQHIPARFAHKGYTVLNDDGRVLRVVERQLTPEEIKIRDAEIARLEAEEAKRQAAIDYDHKLMQLYASPDEVTFAMNTRLTQIDGFIAKLKSDMQQKTQQLSRFQTQAAEKERGQLPVSREILENIDTAESEIERIESEIARKIQEKDQVREKFMRDRDRIYELYDLERPIASSTAVALDSEGKAAL